MTDTASPAPTLLALRDQLNERWSERSQASDGIMGDAAHQARVSDHNQGNAFDVTYDPAHGPDLDALADALMHDPRTWYVIWNRRIRNPAIQAGAWRPYTGESPHTEHLHLSIHPDKRDDTAAWALPGDEAPSVTTATVSEPGEDGGGQGLAFLAGLGLLVATVYLVRRGR